MVVYPVRVSKHLTDQTFRTMLGNFGINVPQGQRPKINNVAAVAVHAEIPAFAKPVKKSTSPYPPWGALIA